MEEIAAIIGSKHQVTLPAAERRHLGVGAFDKIAFVIDASGVRIVPARMFLVDLYGSVEALPGESGDLEREIDEAMSAEAGWIVGRSERS